MHWIKQVVNITISNPIFTDITLEFRQTFWIVAYMFSIWIQHQRSDGEGQTARQTFRSLQRRTKAGPIWHVNWPTALIPWGNNGTTKNCRSVSKVIKFIYSFLSLLHQFLWCHKSWWPHVVPQPWQMGPTRHRWGPGRDRTSTLHKALSGVRKIRDYLNLSTPFSSSSENKVTHIQL